jgi:RecA-family ATPase
MTSDIPHEWRVPPQERNGWPKTLTAAELLGLELSPIRWSVPGMVPEGVTLLAGKPKLGKSWMALSIAIAISTGGVALGTRPVEEGDVLYMALEDNHRRLRKRLEKLLTEEAPERLHIATEWPRMDEGGAEALKRWLEAHPDARLVVVDILKRVRPRTSPNRSVYDADYEALEAMQRLAAEHEVAILVVHHLRKLGATDPLDEISGSTGLSGGADGVLVLKRDRGRADAYLHVTGREIEEEAELALRWDADLASWTLVGDAEEYRVSQER